MTWIRKFLGLCNHSWSIIQTIASYETWDGERSPDELPSYHKYVMQCQKCGNIKTKKV